MLNRVILTVLLSGLLAACGADGAPERPTAKDGLTIEGEASFGIVSG